MDEVWKGTPKRPPFKAWQAMTDEEKFLEVEWNLAVSASSARESRWLLQKYGELKQQLSDLTAPPTHDERQEGLSDGHSESYRLGWRAGRMGMEESRDEWREADAHSVELGARYLIRALAAEAKVKAIRALHRPSDDPEPFCVGCWEAGGEEGAPQHKDCPTLRALDS